MAELRALRCTTIVVAHRLSTGGRRRSHPGVGRGELVERGTHRELLAKNGVYTNLVHAQVDGV